MTRKNAALITSCLLFFTAVVASAAAQNEPARIAASNALNTADSVRINGDQRNNMKLEEVAPIVLLAAIWGAFNVILKAYELMNSARDKIIDPTNNLTRDMRTHILLAEYLPLRISTFLFVVAFVVLVWWIPFESRDFEPILFAACFGVGIVSIGFTMGLIRYYHGDKKILEAYIKNLSEEQGK